MSIVAEQPVFVRGRECVVRRTMTQRYYYVSPDGDPGTHLSNQGTWVAGIMEDDEQFDTRQEAMQHAAKHQST